MMTANRTFQEAKFASFDPGKTTGVVLWDSFGKPTHVSQYNQKDLDDLLERIAHFPPEVFIIEEYRIYGHMARQHIGSKVETAQCIGQLMAFARKYNIKTVEQAATIKNIAQKWSQTKKPTGGHANSHWYDAYLHGYYYLHKSGVIEAKVLEELE